MAISPVEYRREYVSGAITVARAGFPVTIVAQVTNRGGSPGVAQVRVWNEHTLLLPESPDTTVAPESVWIYQAPSIALAGIDATRNALWVQIRTTLPDLVPTLALKESVLGPDDKVHGVRESHFFAPGDFAVFALHPVPVRPPVGPPRDAITRAL